MWRILRVQLIINSTQTWKWLSKSWNRKEDDDIRNHGFRNELWNGSACETWCKQAKSFCDDDRVSNSVNSSCVSFSPCLLNEIMYTFPPSKLKSFLSFSPDHIAKSKLLPFSVYRSRRLNFTATLFHCCHPPRYRRRALLPAVDHTCDALMPRGYYHSLELLVLQCYSVSSLYLRAAHERNVLHSLYCKINFSQTCWTDYSMILMKFAGGGWKIVTREKVFIFSHRNCWPWDIGLTTFSLDMGCVVREAMNSMTWLESVNIVRILSNGTGRQLLF